MPPLTGESLAFSVAWQLSIVGGFFVRAGKSQRKARGWWIENHSHSNETDRRRIF
jgi:hypothetical protein